VPNCKSIVDTEAERKHVRRCARFNNIETRAVKFFFLKGKASKKIHAVLTETLGVRAPLYATVKNGLAQFKRDFSTCDVPRSGRSKRVTTPKIIAQIDELIFRLNQ
jgi:hypothetical protein